MIIFSAEGDSTTNINAWFIDNFHVYEVCPPPIQVEAEFINEPENQRVEVEWLLPESGINNKNIAGYEIYRRFVFNEKNDWVKLNDSLIVNPYYLDYNLPYTNVTYCYRVTTIYESCMSDSSEVACCYVITNISETENIQILVFPNPGKDFISVKSDINMGKITLINSYGVIQDQFIANKENHCTLDISSYQDEIYFLRIETDKGIVVKKISIVR